MFCGWVFDVPYWETVKMIEIKDKKAQELLGLNDKWASFNDFWDEYNEYKLVFLQTRFAAVVYTDYGLLLGIVFGLAGLFSDERSVIYDGSYQASYRCLFILFDFLPAWIPSVPHLLGRNQIFVVH